MNRLTLYREFQKACQNVVPCEAIMYELSEYSVEIRKFRTRITLYVQHYAVSLTFYISGRTVVEIIENNKEGEFKVISDTFYKPYESGRCTLSQLLGDLIYDLFHRSLTLKKRWEQECVERRRQRIKERIQQTENIGNQVHTPVKKEA